MEGSRKGDGVFELIRPYGFRFFRSPDCLGLPRSRDKQAMTWKINPAAAALRAKGFEVTITVDEDTRRTFAEAEADRTEKAERRAERFGDRADQAAANSDALHSQARQMARSILFGQPILAGRHSEQRDRNFRDRIHNAFGRSAAEHERASYWSNREEAAANCERFRKTPPRTLRRIAKLEAELRRVEKWLKGESAGGYTRDVGNRTLSQS